eukprot:103909_1
MIPLTLVLTSCQLDPKWTTEPFNEDSVFQRIRIYEIMQQSRTYRGDTQAILAVCAKANPVVTSDMNRIKETKKLFKFLYDNNMKIKYADRQLTMREWERRTGVT